jgi:hypothetical protein
VCVCFRLITFTREFLELYFKKTIHGSFKEIRLEIRLIKNKVFIFKDFSKKSPK